MDLVNNEIFLDGYGKLEAVINHLSNNVKTKIAPSPIHGIGVFALRDIKVGENLFPIWEHETGIYVIPNDMVLKLPTFSRDLLDMYFINEDCGYKVLRLFKGQNFLFHGLSFCNSAYPFPEKINISTSGIAVKNINKGDEILEWYTENINLEK